MTNQTSSRAERMRAALTQAFSPAFLTITDESSRHAGHVGARAEGETHYKVEIAADAFREMNRVARQRAVYAVLDAEFKSGLHALSLDIKIPDPA